MANIYIVEDDTNIQEIEAIALKNRSPVLSLQERHGKCYTFVDKRNRKKFTGGKHGAF